MKQLLFIGAFMLAAINAVNAQSLSDLSMEGCTEPEWIGDVVYYGIEDGSIRILGETVSGDSVIQDSSGVFYMKDNIECIEIVKMKNPTVKKK